jgi:transposase
VHAAVDTLGHLLALLVSPANEQDRAWVGELAEAVQEATGESVELAYVDAGYSGELPAEEAQAHGISLEVVKYPEAKRGFVLLPRRWIVERDFAWASRFRRLAKATAADHSGGVALCRLRLPLPQSGNRHPRRGSITRSKEMNLRKSVLLDLDFRFTEF